MMSISHLTFKDYSFADHTEVYKVLDATFKTHGISYYLIGANARDVQLYKAKAKPTRITGDIDFAVLVPDFDTYASLQEALIAGGFAKTEFPYRLFHTASNTVIDLMPFGKIQDANKVVFNKNLTLSVLGYKEVHEHSETFALPETDLSIPVTPLEGLFILKWISWQEKPERQKDLDDLAHLLNNAWDLLEEEAYNEHLDLFEEEDFKTINAAARILGRKMKRILANDETLRDNITTLLESTISDKTKLGALEITFAAALKLDIETTLVILADILRGIKEEIPTG
ncbi:nucleotidyl transferase AbiEii/AbiGii toxin family protein [Dokdonia genika]|uniref:Nucleotidyl transferase AbiEii/AbiGii toxin family protein n=1 Tax=Dokdonia genika TaxID=308113 RepID=A0ABV9LC07_9FLAO